MAEPKPGDRIVITTNVTNEQGKEGTVLREYEMPGEWLIAIDDDPYDPCGEGTAYSLAEFEVL